MKDNKDMDRLGVAISWQVPKRTKRVKKGGKLKAFLMFLMLLLLLACAYGLYHEFGSRL